MLILFLTNNLAPVHQSSDVEPQPSTLNTVEALEAQNPTLAEFEVENSIFLSQMCKLFPTWSMTSILPVIPFL